ncbi:MAG: DNA primase [Candidatus Sungbacteria bacterium RIFCSPHIGHO2_02_FULL_49_12]|uniref:DNA primase n=1 Tax=Candidatus Sungbacteria bacterium RIFCSPHIGHO2_02_FULL_49_12 TaxID=1802271 RepID=A0A1G2KM08_9BACT|nr:MAG: DNA primase [Candidatus Sungbacteria bacterium RIFCSPHIGHO2_02_FULL_49_12]
MSDPVIQEIKSRIDILPFVQSYVRLTKAGVNWKGLCPFHSEKTPSFIVSPSRQTWHCFGCSKGGDIFKFLMEMDNVEFRDALVALAERAGVELVREDPKLRTERERMYAIMEEATKFYENQLGKSPAVLEYLKKRGLTKETIKDFRLGYAPDAWDTLSAYLHGRGFTPLERRRQESVEKKDIADVDVTLSSAELKAPVLTGFTAAEFVASGLGLKSEKRLNSYYDRFRNRVMFPLADANGKVIAFSGRIFERGKKTDEAKYVNSPQTLIYDKSRALYGFDKAKEHIRKKNRCVVVEGQMDIILSHQAGVKETVAVSGTALTSKHLEILKRLTDTLISSFDTDDAGETATRRSLDLAAAYDFNRKVAIIPKGKDPADAVLLDPAIWTKAVEEATSLLDFYYARGEKKFSLKTPEGKKEFSRFLLPEIAKLENEIEKAHWVSKMAGSLGIKEDAVWAELRRYKRVIDAPARDRVESESPAKLKTQKLEERILGAYFLYPATRPLLEGHDRGLVFAISPNGEILSVVEGALARDAALESVPELIRQVPEEWREYIDRLIFEVEALFQDVRDAEEEILTCIREVERERLKERLVILAESISQAEKSEDILRLESLLKDFRSASEWLGRL